MSNEEKQKKLKRLINPIASSMRKLQNGDILVWAARLIDEKEEVRVYIIGWLMVNYVLDFTDLLTYKNRNWKQLDNPHMKEEYYILEDMIKYGEVIVIGKKNVSKTKPMTACSSRSKPWRIHPNGIPSFGRWWPCSKRSARGFVFVTAKNSC